MFSFIKKALPPEVSAKHVSIAGGGMLPWDYQPGPDPIAQDTAVRALFRYNLARPLQPAYGYAYPVTGLLPDGRRVAQWNILQPPPTFAMQAVPTVGMGIQMGQFAVYVPPVDSQGNFVVQE